MNIPLRTFVQWSPSSSFAGGLNFWHFKQIRPVRLKPMGLLILCCFASFRILNAQIKYTGTIDRYPIELTLEYPLERAVNPAYFGEHKKVRATYFYTKYKKDIPLEGIWDNKDNLMLVEEIENKVSLFVFTDYDTINRVITGNFKTQNKDKDTIYKVKLTQQSKTKPLVKKLKPITYRSYYRGQQLVLKLHEPFEQILDSLTFRDLKQNKYEMSATLTFVKHDKTFSLKGSWGSRGFILLKGFDPDKNESFYLDIDQYDKTKYEVHAYLIDGTETDSKIIFSRDIDHVTADMMQEQMTPKHYFRILEYTKEENDKGQKYYAIEVYERETDYRIQRIDDLDCNHPDLRFEVGDYNFDGLMDMMLLCHLHVRNATSILALQGPEDGKFYLTKGIDSQAEFDKERKMVITKDHFHGQTTTIYHKWNGGVLEEVDVKTTLENEFAPVRYDPEELRKKLDTSFQITANQVGIFSSGMTVADILLLVPKDQIIKKIGYGEHDETFDDYQIYDAENNHLLTLSPAAQDDPNSRINTIFVIDSRYQTKSGLGMGSTYSDLLKDENISGPEPDLESIFFKDHSIGASLHINKKALKKDWWDNDKKGIDTTKIPKRAKVSLFVMWW